MREAAIQPAIDLGRLAPALGRTCEGYLGGYREILAAAVRRGEPGLETARRHARVLDGLLSALYCASDAASRASGLRPRGRIALVAVGGYGRGTLGIHSDVDVLFLCDDSRDPYAAAVAEGLLYPLWDLGVAIGHVVRGVDETLQLAREDIRTATTLIDLRRIAGDMSIVGDLDLGGRRQVFDPALVDFLDALEQDTRSRHERFGGSLYLLEPEVKQGRGGLRDLDVAEWAARARWNARSQADFVRTGALLPREAKELDAAREMLWRVRNLLHLRAGRQHDRLTFADQEEIAVSLGFVDGVSLGVEQFMQAYYGHARVVAQTAERMLARARPRARRGRAHVVDLGDGTQLFDGHITFDRTERLAEDPAAALRLYRQVVRQDKPPYPFARDAVARIAVDPEWRDRLQRSEEAVQIFLELLAHVGKVPLYQGSIVGELHEVGLLMAMVPELAPLTGRVHHDVYHVYTVDVHTIKAIDRLRALMRSDPNLDLGLATRLAAQAPRPLPLFVALLLQALGKTKGRDHARIGADLARPIARRLGLSQVDVDHVAWLIQEHWSLYHWATQRDVHDDEAVAEVARLVGTIPRLRDLYLVTASVLSTINPNAMTSWKARMLENLYFELTRMLEGSDEIASHESRAAAIREEARVGFVGDAGQEALEAFMAEMPDRYFLANPVDVVRRHARIARDAEGRGVHVSAGPGPSDEVEELIVVCEDRPGLLADVAAALTAHRVSVVSAEIHTRRRKDGRQEAFDVFLVRRERGAGALGEGALERIRSDLIARIEEKITAQELLRRHGSSPAWAVRRGPTVPTEVTVDNEVSSRYTVVDVFTRDRPGLLHVIARTLHEQGVTIGLSKVNTEGDRVADVFYVEDPRHGKLREPARLARLQSVLFEAVRSFQESAQS